MLLPIWPGQEKGPLLDWNTRTRSISFECIASPERLKELGDLIVKGTGQYGSQSFDQAIYWAYKAGQIRLEDALLYAHNPDDLQMRLSGIASDEWVQPDLASIEAGG